MFISFTFHPHSMYIDLKTKLTHRKRPSTFNYLIIEEQLKLILTLLTFREGEIVFTPLFDN